MEKNNLQDTRKKCLKRGKLIAVKSGLVNIKRRLEKLNHHAKQLTVVRNMF